jgi:protein-S-isoprenylcysteine O-methyltransferase Ste14
MNYYALLAGTLVILLFSWFFSIRYRRYHGISRFFAFECILILFLLNKQTWFIDPFSFRQICSWILLFLSLYFAIAGFLLLKRRGMPEGNLENTSRLVKSGIYGYIRHPLYLSLLLLGTGIMLKKTGAWQIAAGSVNLAALWVTCKIEEKEMIAKFGDEYRKYMKETRMFIPFVL